MLGVYTKKIVVMPNDDRARALAHYKQAAKYKRQKMKHKYMAHLLRGDQYMRASALAFGVPLEEPNVEQHGIQYPTSLMVYGYGPRQGIIVAESDDDVPDAPSEPTVYKWNWRQGKEHEMRAINMVCHWEITKSRPIATHSYSSTGAYHSYVYKESFSDPAKSHFFVFRSKHTGTFIACNVAGLKEIVKSERPGAKDADNLIELEDCARLALEKNRFLMSVEDWRDGALLIKQDKGTNWISANPCQTFAYYDFALRKKKGHYACTYTTRKHTTDGGVVIPEAYLSLCFTEHGGSDKITEIIMSSDASGVYCNGKEMMSTTLVPDEATAMSEIRAKFILGLLSDSDKEMKKRHMEGELGAEFLVQARNSESKMKCEREKRASVLIWPEIKDKVACSYDEASYTLKLEADKIKRDGSLASKVENHLRTTYPAQYYIARGKGALEAAVPLVSSSARAVASAGSRALESAAGLVSR